MIFKNLSQHDGNFCIGYFVAWKGNFFFITGSKLVSLELGEMGLSSEATITDMLYQDGAVYMLLRDYNIDSAITSGIGKNSPCIAVVE